VPVESAQNRKAFSALIHAMIETQKVMIAKWTSRRNVSPRLVVLHPYTAPKFECLYMNVLPTVEDIRDYQFKSLIKSTEEQQKTMEDFVDALDMEQVEEEVLEPESTFNPTLQYFNQCVIHRIHNGEEANLPQLNPVIEEEARPSRLELFHAQQAEEDLENAFDIEENQDEIRRRNRRIRLRDIILQGNEEEKEEEGEEVKEEEAPPAFIEEKEGKPEFNFDEKVTKISTLNPVSDFNEMINDREVDRVDEALTQMREIIINFVKDSIEGETYDKALDCLKIMRQGSVENDEPEVFNNYLLKLKDTFKTGAHSTFYAMIINSEIGLITKEESHKSKISKEEAEKFMNEEKEVVKKDKSKGKDQDEDDFLVA
jgi:ATP-dependent DNA helicase 2 subunit 2